MKRLLLFLTFLPWLALGQVGSPIPSTTWTRTWLRATNAEEARLKLDILSTNETTITNWTTIPTDGTVSNTTLSAETKTLITNAAQTVAILNTNGVGTNITFRGTNYFNGDTYWNMTNNVYTKIWFQSQNMNQGRAHFGLRTNALADVYIWASDIWLLGEDDNVQAGGGEIGYVVNGTTNSNHGFWRSTKDDRYIFFDLTGAIWPTAVTNSGPTVSTVYYGAGTNLTGLVLSSSGSATNLSVDGLTHPGAFAYLSSFGSSELLNGSG